MAPSLKLIARLRAYERGQAQRYATCLKVAIQPHALVFCPVAMAGEDTTIHAVAVGRIGQAPVVRVIPDPRKRDDQYQLFEWLGLGFEPYFNRCYEAGDYPQILVSSTPVVDHLSTLADRLRFNKENEKVSHFGALLTYATDRFPYEGQQALQAATRALKLHFATGQDDSEDEHLLASLTWIEPPPGRNVLAAVAEAELIPMGVKTDPEFDRNILEPLVTRYDKAHRAGASDAVLTLRADLIREQLEPVVVSIYEETQRAIGILRSLGIPELPAIPDLEHREREEFANFMESLRAGYRFPLRDSPKRAAFGLSAREDTKENVEAALVLGDAVERAQARLDGQILVGEIENPRRIRIAPWRFEHHFTLRSTQRMLHLRVRDELHLVDDPRLKVIVTDVHRNGRSVTVSLRLLRGQRSVGLPQTGARAEFIAQLPDWERVERERGHLHRRLEVTPWTHSVGELPPTRPLHRRGGIDPLEAVERLQTRRQA